MKLLRPDRHMAIFFGSKVTGVGAVESDQNSLDICCNMGVSKKSWYPKMDGENKGKAYETWDDLGVFTPFFGSTLI